MSTREERERLLDLRDDTGQGTDVSGQGRTAFVGQVTTGGTLPTVAGSVFLVTETDIDGGQAEGDIPTFNATGDPIPCVHVGSKVPGVGDKVLCQSAGGRWVFRNG